MTWGMEDKLTYIYGGGLVVSIFMFFFRRFTRRKFEENQARKKLNQD